MTTTMMTMTTIRNEPVTAAVAEAAKKIPQKIFFRIGEVARLLEVKTSVLRFWETEFPSIHPTKAPSGHRVYRRKEVEKLFLIKQLLYVERFSIEGARKKLSERGAFSLSGGAPTAMTGMVLRSGDAADGENEDGVDVPRTQNAEASVSGGASAFATEAISHSVPPVDADRLRALLARPIGDFFRF